MGAARRDRRGRDDGVRGALVTEMLNRHVADRPADRWRGGEEGRAAPRSFVSSSQVQRQRCRQTMMGEEQAGGTSKFRTGRPNSGLDAQVPDSTPKFRTQRRLRRTLDTQVELSAGSGIRESGDRMQIPQVTFIVLIPWANANQSRGKKPACGAISQTASGLGELVLFSTPAPIRSV